MKKRILLFDIGNTNIKIGFAGPGIVYAAFAIPADRRATGDAVGLALENLLRHMGISRSDVEACVGSSVAPAMTALIRHACARFLDLPLQLAPEDIPIPLENRYAMPAEVGADRLVGAFAARRLFPDAAAIISVDYGTATTFDCVNGNAYLGGLICPGVFSSMDALASRTAKLPHIALSVDENAPVFGRSTTMSINHGFVFGFGAMTEGICRRLAANLPQPLKIVATGGFAQSLSLVVSCFDAVRPDLLLEGLRDLHYEGAYDCAAKRQAHIS